MTDGRDVVDNYRVLSTGPRRELALDCLAAGIEAAHPRRVVGDAVALDGDALRVEDSRYDLSGFSELLVVGGGKAAAQVAAELESILGDRIDDGIVVTNDPVETIRVAVERGDHPVPSDRGVENAREVLARVRGATEDTFVLGVVTGGGSALLSAPPPAVGTGALRETTDALLASGATIHEVNAVRKHLSELKGGRLATAAAPATVACLVLSDVVENDLDVIASGPFVPDRSTYADALAVVDRYDAAVPDAVRRRLERGAAGDLPETPSPGDPAFDRVSHHVVADATTAIDAAVERVEGTGYRPVVLSSRIRGESREAATVTAAIVEESRASGDPFDPPAVVVSGGETTVTVSGDGTGGPNQEYALSAATELTLPGVTVAAVDTDGVDGSTDAAGAVVDATAGRDADAIEALDANDAYPLLDRRGDLVFTGTTGTNVNDLRVVVIDDAT